LRGKPQGDAEIQLSQTLSELRTLLMRRARQIAGPWGGPSAGFATPEDLAQAVLVRFVQANAVPELESWPRAKLVASAYRELHDALVDVRNTSQDDGRGREDTRQAAAQDDRLQRCMAQCLDGLDREFLLQAAVSESAAIAQRELAHPTGGASAANQRFKKLLRELRSCFERGGEGL
jgi:DNA-directed RNA polymerase specialized sigma24 family protein